jgi:hypothetical protein
LASPACEARPPEAWAMRASEAVSGGTRRVIVPPAPPGRGTVIVPFAVPSVTV